MSERDIAKHVNTGELRQTGTEFMCSICSSSLGQQPMQHIQGSTHKNAVFLHALSQPTMYRALYSALPQVVKDAHGKGVVTVKESKFECGPCKMGFTGEKPLTDHLSSSKHLNKAGVQVPPTVLTPPTVGLPTAQPTFPTFSNVNNSGSYGPPASSPPSLIHPVVADAVRNGHVKETGPTDFQRTLCADSKVITGVAPLRQHLEGKAHKKSLQESLLREAGQRVAAGATHHQPQPSYPSVSSQPAFDLRSVNQSITMRFGVPTFGLLSGQSLARANYPYDSDAGPGPMNSTGKMVEKRSAQPCNTYKNSSSPRGVVVIFNYIFKNNVRLLRQGARKDHENLKKVFTKIGYEVWPINIDLTRQETLNKLDEVRKSPKLKGVDSLITVFLSHGGPSDKEFLSFDDKPISVDEILYTKFTDQQCPTMKGKPKLFIFNFCRGEVTQSNSVQYDSSWSPNTDTLEAPTHVAIIHATLPHFKAGRYTNTGTIFVSEFCKVLEQNSGEMELVEIIHETSKQMKKDPKGNTPTVTPVHFGKFKFM